MMHSRTQFHRETEMIEHPNSFLVHQCLQAVNGGDTETLRALWADDIVWHVKGKSPWQGEITGPDAIFEYLAQLGEMGAGDYNVEVEDVMIGAGLAAIALAGAGVGIGLIFGNYLSGAMRNPSAAQKQFPNLLLGFALAEATGLFGLVVALIILFAF